MTNLERIFTRVATYQVGMREAALMMVIHRIRYGTAAFIAQEFRYNIRGTTALISKLKEKGIVIKHGEEAKRLTRGGPRTRTQWKLNFKLQDELDALEARAPLKGRPVIKPQTAPRKRPPSA